MELVIPKSLAMMGQLGIVVAILTTLFFVYCRNITWRSYVTLLLSLSFFALALVSALLTSILHDFHFWVIYLVFNAYLLFVALGSTRLADSLIEPGAFPKIFLFWGWILFFVATLEQLHLVTMPGYSFASIFLIRSASLTGAFLHYPILMALIAYLTLQWYIVSGHRLYLISGLAFCLAPITVVSRSGIFILFFGMFIYWVISLLQGKKAALWLTGLLFAGIAFLALSPSSENSVVGSIADRIISAPTMKAAGNVGRIKSWMGALETWSDSNLFVGEYTGTITNSTRNVFENKSTIAESGVLQQLVNFGFLGLLAFYALLLYVGSQIRREHQLLRIVYLAAMTQTLFYQSIEVMPFITLLLLMPWISDSYARLQPKPIFLEKIGPHPI